MYGVENRIWGDFLLREFGIFVKKTLTCNPDTLDMKKITLLVYFYPITKLMII